MTQAIGHAAYSGFVRLVPRKAWRRRVVYAILKAVDEHVWHAAYYGELSGCIVAEVREASRAVTGGNCAFVDDDLHILTQLALRACDAGLTDKLAPDVRKKAERLAAARQAEGTEAAGSEGEAEAPGGPQ